MPRGAKGNEGIAKNVGQTKGLIGYVEYAYAKQNKLTFTKLINADGRSVAEPVSWRHPLRLRGLVIGCGQFERALSCIQDPDHVPSTSAGGIYGSRSASATARQVTLP